MTAYILMPPDFYRGYLERLLRMSVVLRPVLQARQPKLMPLVHGVRLLLTELNGARSLHNLLCDDVAPLRGLGKKERVISMDVLTISEPSEAAIRLKLPHAAFDVESEGLPRYSCVLPEPMIRSDQNLDVLRVRVPGGPSLCIDKIGESDLASGLDIDPIVRKEVRLLGLESLGP